jgi:hypothetical protein
MKLTTEELEFLTTEEICKLAGVEYQYEVVIGNYQKISWCEDHYDSIKVIGPNKMLVTSSRLRALNCYNYKVKS